MAIPMVRHAACSPGHPGNGCARIVNVSSVRSRRFRKQMHIAKILSECASYAAASRLRGIAADQSSTSSNLASTVTEIHGYELAPFSVPLVPSLSRESSVSVSMERNLPVVNLCWAAIPNDVKSLLLAPLSSGYVDSHALYFEKT
jgi:hypothetical protein